MITVRDIHKSFGSLEVLRGVSFDIERGSVVSIVGASGAGKTTLLQIMGTLSRADRGEVLIDGVATEKLNDNDLSVFRNRRIGFVFQAHNLLPEFTALENVCLPGFIAGRDKEEVEAQAVELLRGLDLSERALHKPAQMSGGEQQRVAVARALINQPAVLLADEPSGNLDTHNRRELHRLFFDLRERTGQTVVIVTHDEELASSTHRTLGLVDGLLVNE